MTEWSLVLRCCHRDCDQTVLHTAASEPVAVPDEQMAEVLRFKGWRPYHPSPPGQQFWACPEHRQPDALLAHYERRLL